MVYGGAQLDHLRGHVDIARTACAEAVLQSFAQGVGEDVALDERVAVIGNAHGAADGVFAAHGLIKMVHIHARGVVFDAGHARRTGIGACGFDFLERRFCSLRRRGEVREKVDGFHFNAAQAEARHEMQHHAYDHNRQKKPDGAAEG